ncbi:MAG TPA: c-type cytochrome [Bauldia sp.]|nr:c-type cytochrome [Bauldia sp.]
MRGALVAMAAALFIVGLPAAAQDAAATAPDTATLATGQKAWNDGACANCHGARGQGGTSIDFPKGPSLRTTGLDHDGFVSIISCGIPGTRMPAWLKGAYTEKACNGAPLGAIPPGTTVSGAFTADQISALADYILATFAQPPG